MLCFVGFIAPDETEYPVKDFLLQNIFCIIYLFIYLFIY